jgi:hypothetical protein
MSNDGASLAILGLFAMSVSASAGAAAFVFASDRETKSPKQLPAVTTEIESTNCQGDTKIMKKACHNVETGDVFDGTPDKCGQGKELWVPDPQADGYVAARGDGTCEGELRDCSVDCPTPCSGGEWVQDTSDFCKIVAYDDSNPPQKVETRLDGTMACGTGVVGEVLDETRGNFVAAKGLGACTKQRIGSCEVACPAGMTASSGCAYYSNRQKSANGCMKSEDAEYNPDGSNNVGCGESGKQEFFYLPINASTCGRLSEWEPCTGPPCPVDCVGNWRQASTSNPEGWEACVGNCDQQPEKKRVYNISVEALHGGAACPHADGHTEYAHCGSITPCCAKGAWTPGSCSEFGFNTWTRTLTENSPGACSGVASTDIRECPADCQGEYSDPPCPTECGTPASTLTKEWTTRVPQKLNGTACPPSTTTKECPATPACEECYYPSNDTTRNLEHWANALAWKAWERCPNKTTASSCTSMSDNIFQDSDTTWDLYTSGYKLTKYGEICSWGVVPK